MAQDDKRSARKDAEATAVEAQASVAANESDEAAEDHLKYLEFRRQEHNRRMLKKMSGMTLAGVRLHKESDPNAPGLVINLLPEEAPVVLEAIATVLRARQDL